MRKPEQDTRLGQFDLGNGEILCANRSRIRAWANLTWWLMSTIIRSDPHYIFFLDPHYIFFPDHHYIFFADPHYIFFPDPHYIFFPSP
jgi:hypothetical protein